MGRSLLGPTGFSYPPLSGSSPFLSVHSGLFLFFGVVIGHHEDFTKISFVKPPEYFTGLFTIDIGYVGFPQKKQVRLHLKICASCLNVQI